MTVRAQISSTKAVAKETKDKAESVKEDATKATNTLANYKDLSTDDRRKTKEVRNRFFSCAFWMIMTSLSGVRSSKSGGTHGEQNVRSGRRSERHIE